MPALRASLVSEKDRLTIEEKKVNIPYIKAKTRLAESRAEALSKVGGKVQGTPQTRDVESAETLLKSKLVLSDKIELRNAAYAVASRARGLQAENRALDSDTAMNSALQEAIDSGEFVNVPRKFLLTDIDIPGTSKTRFVRGGKSSSKTLDGKTIETALELPANKQLLPNTYYKTSRGNALWTGENFVGGDDD